jgi:8-oxo-dGTP diphosphatase
MAQDQNTAQANHGQASMWPRCAVSAAIFRGEEVLLIERGKGTLRGFWSLPGGHIEAGETARAAALREVREETGVAAELVGLVDVHDVIRHGPGGTLAAHYLIAVFWGRWLAGEPLAGSDAAAARFVALADLPSYRLTDGAIGLIRRAAQLATAHHG